MGSFSMQGMEQWHERSGSVRGAEAGAPLLKGGKEGWERMDMWIKQEPGGHGIS